MSESLPSREAELGELLHDAGEEDPEHGWFILGVDGYFDVDNACWCEFEPTDAPWTTEHFEMFGTIPDSFARRVGLAEHYLDAMSKPPLPITGTKADYLLDGSPEAVAVVREARGLTPTSPQPSTLAEPGHGEGGGERG